MGKMLNVGYGNVVNSDKIVAVIRSDSAPAKRMVQTAKDSGKAIDATQGRKTKSLIITEGDMVVLSALMTETIAARYKDDFDKGDNNEE